MPLNVHLTGGLSGTNPMSNVSIKKNYAIPNRGLRVERDTPHPLVGNSLTPVFINTRVIAAITAITAIIVIVGLVVTDRRGLNRGGSPVISSLSRRRRARGHIRTLTLPYTCTLVDVFTRVRKHMLDTLVCWARTSLRADHHGLCKAAD